MLLLQDDEGRPLKEGGVGQSAGEDGETEREERKGREKIIFSLSCIHTTSFFFLSLSFLHSLRLFFSVSLFLAFTTPFFFLFLTELNKKQMNRLSDVAGATWKGHHSFPRWQSCHVRFQPRFRHSPNKRLAKQNKRRQIERSSLEEREKIDA